MKNISRLNEEKGNTGIRFKEPATNLTIRHTMTNSRKQQHCCNNASIAYTQSSSSGSNTLYAYKADLSIAQTTPQTLHVQTFNYGSRNTWRQQNKRENGTQKEKRHPDFDPPTLSFQGQRPTCWPTRPTLLVLYAEANW